MTRVSRGLTLVELLVVVGVVGLLLALIFPAVQSVRESARQTACQNNLKQIGLATLHHEQAQRHFPTNGWGYLWIGEPDRGFGPRQPGGWIYNVLPYLEAASLRELGRGADSDKRRAERMQLMNTPLPMFDCPTRDGRGLGPQSAAVRPVNAPWTTPVAKTDYAINEGDFATETLEGPASIAEGDSPTHRWKDVSRATGVSFQRSTISAADVEDGLSLTYLVGEKYVRVDGPDSANDYSHDQCMYTGVDWDINRWTIDPPFHDNVISLERRFGSAHANGAYFVFCDGAVRLIGFQVDRETHRRLGNRRDGRHVELPSE